MGKCHDGQRDRQMPVVVDGHEEVLPAGTLDSFASIARHQVPGALDTA
jgi:hypothetical protein